MLDRETETANGAKTEIIATKSIVPLSAQQLQQNQSDHRERSKSPANGSNMLSTPTTSPIPADCNTKKIDNSSTSNCNNSINITNSFITSSSSNCSFATPILDLESEPLEIETTNVSPMLSTLPQKAMENDSSSGIVIGITEGGGDDIEKQHYSLNNNSSISVEVNGATLPNENGSDINSPIMKISRPGTPMLAPRPPQVAGNCPSIGVNLRVTGQCSQGGRKYMEDYFSVAYQEAKGGDAGTDDSKELEYAFFGIYDGHGGAEAALFAKENLMIEIVSQKLFWSDSDEDVLRAIREGYISTHFAMWREHERWPRTANGHLSTAGTTATVAFLRREKIYIGHVGDSGVVLGYQNEHENFWRAKPLTTDHKPESHIERKRIQRSGGSVTIKSGVPRVVWNRPRDPKHRGPIRHNTVVDEIPFLAVARSLGDLWSYNSEYNEFVVSPDPDVKMVKIDPKTFRCLIFGTDGLWNVVNAQEAVDVVYEKERINNALRRVQSFSGGNISERCLPSANPSKGLVEKALKTWSAKKMRADNTSVLTVILYPNKSHAEKGGSESCNISKQISAPSVASNGLKSIPPCASPSTVAQTYLTYGNGEILVKEYEHNVPYGAVAKKFLPPLEYRNFLYYEEVGDEEELVIEEHYEVDEDEGVNSMDHMSILESAITQNGARCDWDHICAKNLRKTCRCQTGTKEFSAPETNEWVELEIDRDGDCNSISAEISTTTMLTKPTPALAPTAEMLETKGIDMEYQVVRDLVADDTVDDELYNDVENEEEEVFVEPVDLNELEVGVDVDGVLEHSNEHGYMSTDECIETDQLTTDYSFAESYNSLLNEQEARNSASNSSSPASGMASSSTNYQSIDTNCMQEILQEQQRYQQQEGYSLTKLETRREQQRNNVLCHVVTGSANEDEDEDDIAKDMTTYERVVTRHGRRINWSEDYVTTTAAVSRCHQLGSTREAQLLELNSLLEQEREEEQRVALEQRAMQQVTMLEKYTDEEEIVENDVSIAFNIVDISSSSSRILDSPLVNENSYKNYDELATFSPQETTEVVKSIRSQSSATMPTPTSTLTSLPSSTSLATLSFDCTLQSNEVSSTDLPDVHCMSVDYVKQTVDEIRQEDSSAVTYIFEQIQKLKNVDYTPVSKTVKAAVKRAVAIAAGRGDTSALETDLQTNKPTMTTVSTGVDAVESTSATTMAKLRRMCYRNVPNENIMQTRRRNRSSKFKRKQVTYMNGAAAAIIAFNASTLAANNSHSNRRIHKGNNKNNKNSNTNVKVTPLNLSCNHSNASVGVASIASKRNERSIDTVRNTHNSTTASVSSAIIRSPYATRNEVRINKRQLRSTIHNLDLAQRTLRARNSLPKNVKTNTNSRSLTASSVSQPNGSGSSNSRNNNNNYQKRNATSGALSQTAAKANGNRKSMLQINLKQQQQQQKQQQQQRQHQTVLGKRRTEQQQTTPAMISSPMSLTMAKSSTTSVYAQPAVTYLNLRSRRILDGSHRDASASSGPSSVISNGKRLEYRRSLRRTNVGGNNSIGCSVGGGMGNPIGGSFSKSTRLQSAIGAIVARPPPSPKKLTLTTIGNSRQTAFSAATVAAAVAAASASTNSHNNGRSSHSNSNSGKVTDVLVDLSKRWSLRSQRTSESSSSGTALTFKAATATPSVSIGKAAGIRAAGLTEFSSLEGVTNNRYNGANGANGSSSRGTSSCSTIATRTRLNRKR